MRGSFPSGLEYKSLQHCFNVACSTCRLEDTRIIAYSSKSAVQLQVSIRNIFLIFTTHNFFQLCSAFLLATLGIFNTHNYLSFWTLDNAFLTSITQDTKVGGANSLASISVFFSYVVSVQQKQQNFSTTAQKSTKIDLLILLSGFVLLFLLVL